MNSSLARFIIGGMLLCVVGCTAVGSLTPRHLAQLRIGMAPQDVKKVWQDRSPKDEYAVKVGDPAVAVTIHSYRIRFGEAFVMNLYLAYDVDGLLFWGYPYEFMRSDNVLLRGAAAKVYELVPAAKKKARVKESVLDEEWD